MIHFVKLKDERMICKRLNDKITKALQSTKIIKRKRMKIKVWRLSSRQKSISIANWKVIQIKNIQKNERDEYTS